MEKIKIINLIKLVYEDKAPEKIRFRGFELVRTPEKDLRHSYIDDDGQFLFKDYSVNLKESAEIIEEDNNKIEKLPKWATTREDKEYTKQEDHILVVAQKVDEIIDKINNME